jgi:hypothetical protein
MGGTVAPWADARLRREWMTRGRCGSSSLATASDFGPAIAELLASYRYVWIYAAGAAGYNPFEPTVSGDLEEVVRAARAGRTAPRR